MYLAQFGFEGDPFQSTNAADEPNISEYFVPPPYFDAVVGDPSQPRSQVIMAPRGGGKTAQKVMLEKSSQKSKDYLCVVYDEFLFSEGIKVSDIDLEYHIRNVNELITLALLLECDFQGIGREDLPSQKVSYLKQAVEIYLGRNSQNEHSTSIGKFKNIGEKASDIWDKYGGKINVLANAVLSCFGFASINLSDLAKNPEHYDQSHKFYLKKLSEIAVNLGYKSIYVLVDRVDETSITNSNAKDSYEFISSLLNDLHVLETPNLAFKFFLWDQIKSYYEEDGARPDRIKIFTLNWSVNEISRMLSERLSAYSRKNITSFNDITESDLDCHLLACYMANSSPRDLIRVCGRIIDEHVRLGKNSEMISEQKVWEGVKSFCIERASELYPRFVGDLRKIGTPTFTNRMLANEVFRVSENAIRPKIQAWQNNGAVDKIGEVANPGNRPLYLYGLMDVRLCVSSLYNISIQEIFGNYLLSCPKCHKINISDQIKVDCNCGETFKIDGAKSLLDLLS